MRKWDDKPTLTLEYQACELQGKIVANKCSRKTTVPASIGFSSTGIKRADVTFDLNKETFALLLTESSELIWSREALLPSGRRKGQLAY